MADVRFLRHLRDTNPKKTTLVRGRRVTREDALEEKLAAAKQGESDILAKLTSLRGHGKTTKKKQENNEKRFRWITEAKKLNQTEVHLWNDALDTLTRQFLLSACAHDMPCLVLTSCMDRQSVSADR